MKYENEITVEVNCDLQELQNILEDNQFKIMEEYDVNDIYMIDKLFSSKENSLDLLKHCVLLRDIIESDKRIKKITYKYKEYNSNNEIVKQGKTDCNVTSITDAKKLLEAINYEELIKINDHLIVVTNDVDEMAIQLVNKKHIYIEIEEKCNFIDKHYNSIEEMKNAINKYSIPVKDNNYFAKKAEVEIDEKRRKI